MCPLTVDIVMRTRYNEGMIKSKTPTGTRTLDDPQPLSPLQELYNKFDGTGNSDARLAWYGQCRAKGLNHDEAIADTANHFRIWVAEVWPARGIPLP